jgi:hypothetical protein
MTPKYTAEQIDEIIGRIADLRKRWLALVETQLASRQSPPSSTATSLTPSA